MLVKKEQTNPTSVTLTISADTAALVNVKQDMLRRIAKEAKLPGFRPGKAPLGLVEKQTDHARLQSEFLNEAINRLYSNAIQSEKLRPVQSPHISISKFVPFTALEFTAAVEVVGEIKVGNYKKIHLPKKPVTVTDKDIDAVVHNLRQRLAERAEVQRACREGDEVVIDFLGRDAKTNELVNGADGKKYPLILGSNTFIPGFEENIMGLKAGAQKAFTITFPKNYGVKTLQNKKVTFEVTVISVHQLTEAKADEAFAAKVGPFQSLEALRDDIKQQLRSEKQSQSDREYENELLAKVAQDAVVAIPSTLIDEEVRRTEQQVRQNLVYRGQTWQEYLNELGQNEEEYRTSLHDPAEQRVKAGLVLTEVADQEKITVAPEELKSRLQQLKGEYTDPAMRAELEKPENLRSIMSGLLSEKTIAKLTDYATRSA